MTEETQQPEDTNEVTTEMHVSDDPNFNTMETLVGDIQRVALDIVKALPTGWQQLSEEQQERWLNYLDQQTKAAAKRVVTMVAGNGGTVVRAKLDSVTFKGGVKAVLKVPEAAEHVLELAEAEGGNVAIVISDYSWTESESGKPQADPDQPELDVTEEQDGDSEEEEQAEAA